MLTASSVPADGLLLNIYSAAAQLFIAASAAVAILSFFGCCGAFKVNRRTSTVRKKFHGKKRKKEH